LIGYSRVETSGSLHAVKKEISMSSTLIPLTQGVWTQITTTSKEGFIRHHQGSTKIVYVVAPSVSSALDPTTAVMHDTIMGSQIIYDGVDKDDFVWAYAISSDAKVVVTDNNGDYLSLDADYFNGDAGMIKQSYTEANVKNGLQFSASTYFTGLTAGENLDLIVITGDKPIIVKSQYIEIKEGGDVISEWYRDPVYTGGSDITSGIGNQNDKNSEATTLQLIGCLPTDEAVGKYSPKDATKPNVTNIGTKILPKIVTLGVIGQGSSVSARSSIAGLEHILRPNTTYLYRRKSIAACDSFFGFSTWFEGEPDLPRA
jgi:hypothetical protein